MLISDGHGSHVTPEFIIHCMFHNIILLILPPHTLHLTQLLDVTVFSLLKQHMTAELRSIIQTEIARLQKAEWLSAYVQARKQAFCTLNILSAFSGTGLFPFNPDKVLGRIPSQPSETIRNTTSDPTISPLQYPLLTSSPADITIFRAANNELQHRITNNPSLTTPERTHINRLARSSEKLYARTSIKEQENSALKEVIHSHKNQATGTRGILKNQHCITRSGIYAQLAEKKRAAQEKKAEKRLHAGKRAWKSFGYSNPPPSLDSSIDPAIFEVQDIEADSEDDSQLMEDSVLGNS